MIESEEQNGEIRAPRAGRARWPVLLLMALDIGTLVVIIVLLAVARYDMTVSSVNRQGLGLSLALAASVYLVTYGLLVARRHRWSTPDELVGLGMVAVCLSACLSAASALTAPSLLPLSVAITTAPCAMSAWLLLRYAAVQFHRARQRRLKRVGRPTLVVGAGAGARQALSMMLQDARSTLHPVALLDDDPLKRHLGIQGVRVRGRVADLRAVVRETRAEVVLFAIPTASASLVERVVADARQAGAELLVLPSFDEMLTSREAPTPAGSQVDIPRQAFRPVLLEDLLGRGQIQTDAEGIGAYLRDKVVLVTGAGGSIGSQLCREIAVFEPRRLVMTDRDDSLLHAVQLSVDGQGALDSENLVLGDLRSPEFIARLVADVRPDVVFHAAAIKHLTLAERFPVEAFMTNVVGSAELLRACTANGVGRFVNISTDKAADPRSVLGYTKRVTERLTATFGRRAGEGARYISVRFGNVLGSRGSALTTFAAQLAAGRPLTITSPDMTRYFMTVHEACMLVLQAAVDGRTGEGLVLDMGEPHNIEQLARRFAALQGYPVPMVTYTGARPGEKINETTLAAREPDERPFHPLISRVHVPTLPDDLLLDITSLSTRPGATPEAEVREWLLDVTATEPRPDEPVAAEPSPEPPPAQSADRRVAPDDRAAEPADAVLHDDSLDAHRVGPSSRNQRW